MNRNSSEFWKQDVETNGLSASFEPTEPLPGRGGTERSRERKLKEEGIFLCPQLRRYEYDNGSWEREMSAPVEHIGAVLKFETDIYQAFCTCGWASSVTYYEEADLLRAIHAHELATFRGAR